LSIICTDFVPWKLITLCSPGKFSLADFVRAHAQNVTAEIYPVQPIVINSLSLALEAVTGTNGITFDGICEIIVITPSAWLDNKYISIAPLPTVIQALPVIESCFFFLANQGYESSVKFL